MQYQTPFGTPDWNDGRDERLFVSMLAATAIVAFGLMLVQLPVIPGLSPLAELIVRIVETPDEPFRIEELQPETVYAEEVPPEPEARTTDSAAPTVAEPAPVRDMMAELEAARQRAIDEFVDSQQEDWGYFNPDLTEKRRELSGQHQPPTHPGERPIWENVEKDTLGRTVLRSGNCYKVLEDPNVTRRDQFEVFDQNMVQCMIPLGRRQPRELPWVAIIRERYEYLRNPAGFDEDEYAQ